MLGSFRFLCLSLSISSRTEFDVLSLRTENLISVSSRGYHHHLQRKEVKDGANVEHFRFYACRNSCIWSEGLKALAAVDI